MWSVKCGVRSVKWKVWSVKCRLGSVECAVVKVWSVAGDGDLVVLLVMLL